MNFYGIEQCTDATAIEADFSDYPCFRYLDYSGFGSLRNLGDNQILLLLGHPLGPISTQSSYAACLLK